MVGGDDQQGISPVIAVGVVVEIIDGGLDRLVEIDLLLDHPAGKIGMVGPVNGAPFDHDSEAVGIIVEDIQGRLCHGG